jgi:hypothetical protein
MVIRFGGAPETLGVVSSLDALWLFERSAMLRPMLSRRLVLRGIGLGCAALAAPRLASATLARAVTLPELVGLSRFALVGTATDASSRWETAGDTRRIVTYVRLEVTQPIDGRPPPETSLMLRTMGGRVGDLGQLVHGEARFELGAPAVVFITPDMDGVLGVTAMAQGHYPLGADPDDAVRLRASPNIPSLVRVDGSAVQRLVRRTVFEAEGLVSDILRAR